MGGGRALGEHILPAPPDQPESSTGGWGTGGEGAKGVCSLAAILLSYQN